MGKHLLYTWEMRRTLLAIYLIISRGGVWLIEQPSSSLLYRHPRFEELLKMQTVVRHLKNKGFVFCFSDTLRDTVHSWISLGFQAKSSWRRRWPQVFKQSFWMQGWGSKTPKRTVLWSNSTAIRLFKTGAQHSKPKKNKVDLTGKYRDRTGRLRYKGNRHLKQSQWQPQFNAHVVQM